MQEPNSNLELNSDNQVPDYKKLFENSINDIKKLKTEFEAIKEMAKNIIIKKNSNFERVQQMQVKDDFSRLDEFLKTLRRGS